MSTEMVDNYFSNNYNRILNYARTLSHRHYEDIVHDTYIECKKYERNIRNVNRINSYVMTVMRRVAQRYYDIYNKEEIKHMDNMIEIDNDFSNMYLNEILEKLEFEEQVIVLYLVEGFNQREISEMMDIKYSTLRDKVQRIRKKLESIK